MNQSILHKNYRQCKWTICRYNISLILLLNVNGRIDIENYEKQMIRFFKFS